MKIQESPSRSCRLLLGWFLLLGAIQQRRAGSQHRPGGDGSPSRNQAGPVERGRLALVEAAPVPKIRLGAAQAGMAGLDGERTTRYST
ncbi:MAG: hypothetical protein U0401_18135 [Anaerolineae bacterium]